ncbi:hypothetical protein Murru_3182 [Allomuricauda ruestringensis DSM 13258]|uniref:Uncharacterized protein n=1 Tax=Allomuricauda ruestringensis (strain DSM 13258 / CIP 107369 / LMG 19739 / B1) TaxID=886377 RepID=G2PLT3_ALLRU|nr:hypothetical protein [Allomuricauda ruestringensis]AEM72202.1 hypothetical protein Murru_3182 [Allomuricauda ruestringensis DSM 13258]
MSTQDGQKNCPHCGNENSQSAPKISRMLTPEQVELLEFADHLDGPDLVKSLKLVHDVVLYHSHEPIDEAEKDALFNLKGLWECIDRIGE